MKRSKKKDGPKKRDSCRTECLTAHCRVYCGKTRKKKRKKKRNIERMTSKAVPIPLDVAVTACVEHSRTNPKTLKLLKQILGKLNYNTNPSHKADNTNTT